MTNQEKKRILRAYRFHMAQAQALDAELRTIALPHSASITGMPKGSGNQSDLSDVVARSAKILAKLKAEQDRQYEALELITSTIDAMANESEKAVLRLHYIKGYRLAKVATELGYSYDRVCHIHGSALANFKVDKL